MHHPLELRRDGSTPIPIPYTWLAHTKYWDRFLKAERLSKRKESGRVFRFTRRRVCQRHQTDDCRYGADCKNIHVCRPRWAALLASGALQPPPTQPGNGSDVSSSSGEDSVSPTSSTLLHPDRSEGPRPGLDPTTARRALEALMRRQFGSPAPEPQSPRTLHFVAPLPGAFPSVPSPSGRTGPIPPPSPPAAPAVPPRRPRQVLFRDFPPAPPSPPTLPADSPWTKTVPRSGRTDMAPTLPAEGSPSIPRTLNPFFTPQIPSYVPSLSPPPVGKPYPPQAAPAQTPLGGILCHPVPTVRSPQPLSSVPVAAFPPPVTPGGPTALYRRPDPSSPPGPASSSSAAPGAISTDDLRRLLAVLHTGGPRRPSAPEFAGGDGNPGAGLLPPNLWTDL
jgi:hypothetical protein